MQGRGRRVSASAAIRARSDPHFVGPLVAVHAAAASLDGRCKAGTSRVGLSGDSRSLRSPLRGAPRRRSRRVGLLGRSMQGRDVACRPQRRFALAPIPTSWGPSSPFTPRRPPWTSVAVARRRVSASCVDSPRSHPHCAGPLLPGSRRGACSDLGDAGPAGGADGLASASRDARARRKPIALPSRIGPAVDDDGHLCAKDDAGGEATAQRQDRAQHHEPDSIDGAIRTSTLPATSEVTPWLRAASADSALSGVNGPSTTALPNMPPWPWS